MFTPKFPERLTLVAYLSGKRRTAKWHTERDTPAARIVVTSNSFIERLMCEIEDEHFGEKLKFHHASLVFDIADDDENQAVLDFLRDAVQFTDYIHIIEGDNLDC